MEALECSLLNRPHEILLHLFPRPFAASASPAPGKIPVRGHGGRVADSGLAHYGDFWTRPWHRLGNHFRAYGDDVKRPREWGGIVTFVYLGFGKQGTNMFNGQTSLHPRRWVDPGPAPSVSHIPVGDGSVHGDGASSLGLLESQEAEEGSDRSDRPAYHPINRLHGRGPTTWPLQANHGKGSPVRSCDFREGSPCPARFAGNGVRHSTLFDLDHQAPHCFPAVDRVPEPPSPAAVLYQNGRKAGSAARLFAKKMQDTQHEPTPTPSSVH